MIKKTTGKNKIKWEASIHINYIVYHLGTFRTKKEAKDKYDEIRKEWFGSKLTSRSHGYTNTPTYKTWVSMKDRCLNKNSPSYSRYGGRGIVIHKDWMHFKNFLIDMGERPKNKSLDRINNDLGYCKENCRWATSQQQNLNKGLQKRNKTGVKGVYFTPSNKYSARITRNKRVYVLGVFDTLADAKKARHKAEAEFNDKKSDKNHHGNELKESQHNSEGGTHNEKTTNN